MPEIDRKRTALIKIGENLVASTNGANDVVMRTAASIMGFVEEHARLKVGLDVGTDDVLPALYSALGSSLESRRKLIDARLAAFRIAREHKILASGEMCPCAEGPPPPSGETNLTIVAMAA